MIHKHPKLITYIDLFSGCGGMSEGFQMAGTFEGLAHVDYEFPMVSVLRNRLCSNHDYSEIEALRRVIHMDISQTKLLLNGFTNPTREMDKIQQKFLDNSNDFLEGGLLKVLDGRQIQVVIGGPSCQAYSMAGRAQSPDGMKTDPRNFLFESFVTIVSELKPDIFVFENVLGMLSAKPDGKTNITQLMYEAFGKIGYLVLKDMKEAIFDMSEYGVPQKRKRVIIFGVRKDGSYQLDHLYKKLKNKSNREDIRTVSDAIRHLPKLKPKMSIGQNDSHAYEPSILPILFHEPRFHNDRDQQIFYEWVDDEWNKKPLEKQLQFYQNHDGIKRTSTKGSRIHKYRNLEWDKPSPTIVAHLKKDGLLFIHPDKEQKRTLTVKECALLQGFPDDYEFSSSPGRNYQMIGNAVPPIFVKALAEVISDILIKQQ